ncbi:hypothetical protein CTRI78_v011619 [Colletotrichum trifolii]|uniref:Uncharacterized protein n=1 Tax=Colletotrichum trifolii TaxID=5466 RepID=A0A4R8QAA2_COLTR|nr:hypothetical protein CTRI78_v011619 [Colletotrichum trifolii]
MRSSRAANVKTELQGDQEARNTARSPRPGDTVIKAEQKHGPNEMNRGNHCDPVERVWIKKEEEDDDHSARQESLSTEFTNSVMPDIRKDLRDKVKAMMQGAMQRIEERSRLFLNYQDKAHLGYAVLRNAETTILQEMKSSMSSIEEAMLKQLEERKEAPATGVKREMDDLEEGEIPQDEREIKRQRHG